MHNATSCSKSLEHLLTIPAISDYGIIGNCHTAALVSRTGSIDWLCLPRFDSPSLFARILDVNQGGFWTIQPAIEFESSHHYLDATNVLKTTFTCNTGKVQLLDFMEVTDSHQTRHPHAPRRLIRIIEGLEGQVDLISICVPRPNYAQLVPNFEDSGATVLFDRFQIHAPTPWQVDPQAHTLTAQFTLQAGERLAFALAMQDSSTPHINAHDALESAIAFWQHWANQCTYQGRYRDEVIRSALALKLMTYAPSGAIVAAPTTSLPEEIGGERNWDYRYTWIRDASFTLYALLLAGYLDNESPFFDWLKQTVQVEKTGIQILYPITADGQTVEQTLDYLQGYRNSRPVRIGNNAVGQVQLDVYGEVLSAVHFAWKAGKYDPSGLWDDICPMLNWIVDHWQEPDNGIWEVRGGERHFVYGKAMLSIALNCGIDMAKSLNLSGDCDRWQQVHDAIRAEVLEKGWSDQLQAFKQSYEDETLDAANLLLPVMGFIDGTDPRMISTIDATLQHLVANGLCYRYRRAPEGVKGKESSFVLCTFWLINALILANRVDEAAAWFEQMLSRSTSLGLFAEEIDPETGEQLGNFPQAFSHLGVINVAVSLAHIGHTGTVQLQHKAAAAAAGHGGSGAAAAKQRQAKPLA
ncbi:glycoside hydrolase family 15 protein [Oculatella sp. LEGE 06141]|uniref:glycoside hydrolase family 15 protein n=1 Tax=Oculatella sp. LEGE 06141 TaxID=1828648 RepID=UPI00187ECF80|nr:glycoside hydrolase family 15 protein [Oculatella sp. LEGE 06141]MBE9182700.1 glycoside hydrolase family 15 protein [Oculatella sp. LEGE 06141]